jgi:hypothetical protein
METCRHFRFQVPSEMADELRDADAMPCAVCDAMPHRMHQFSDPIHPQAVSPYGLPVPATSPAQAVHGWLVHLFTLLRPHHGGGLISAKSKG